MPSHTELKGLNINFTSSWNLDSNLIMFLFWTQQYIHMLFPSEDVAPSETVNASIYWQKKILEENKLTFLGNVLPQVAEVIA